MPAETTNGKDANNAASTSSTKKTDESRRRNGTSSSSTSLLSSVLSKLSVAVLVVALLVTLLMNAPELRDRLRGTKVYPPDVSRGDTMLSWFDRYHFAYKIPSFALVESFVRDPDSFVLPTGQMFPAPPPWWNFDHISFRWKVINWFAKRTPGLVQDYPPGLYWYRILQAGILLADGGVDPGTYPELLQRVAEADADPRGDCRQSIRRRIDLMYNLMHTAEDFHLLMRTLDELCEETCLTPWVCTDKASQNSTFDKFIREIRSVIYLRYGEQVNCREHHTHESCLIPIQGSGRHQKRYGSEKAIEALMLQLELDPSHIGAVWLLNIAHMTLGSWPDGVPKQFLIPPSAFESEADIGHFVNIAGGLHIDAYSALGSAIADDFNNDGFVDVFHTGSAYDDQVFFSPNPGKDNEPFSEIHEKVNLTGVTGGCNAKQADYNNDGILDIFITRGGWVNVKQPNSLLRGNADGTYTEVTLKAFDKISLEATHSAEWADFDHDGLLDLYVVGENNNCELWHNLGNDKFEEIAGPSGVRECGLAKGSQWGDFDNDGYPDLAVSPYGHNNKMWRNNGKPNMFGRGWSFTDISESAGILEPVMSFPCAVFDANQDGWLDILFAGHLFEGADAIGALFAKTDYWARSQIIDKIWGSVNNRFPRLYINNKNLTFTDISEHGLRRVLMTMAMNVGDLNNDGYPEIYFATGQPDIRALQPNRMFLNVEGKEFKDITTSAGFGNLQKGHAPSFTDIDNDGDLDVTAAIGGAWYGDYFHDAVFLNPGGHGNKWVKVKLEGVYENRLAFGARINVTAEMENGSTRSFYNMVHTGASYGSNGINNGIHLGLAKAKKILSIDIYWPRANKVQHVTGDIPMETLIYIKEGHNFEVRKQKPLHYDPELLTQEASCSHHWRSHVPFETGLPDVPPPQGAEEAMMHAAGEHASCH